MTIEIILLAVLFILLPVLVWLYSDEDIRGIAIFFISTGLIAIILLSISIGMYLGTKQVLDNKAKYKKEYTYQKNDRGEFVKIDSTYTLIKHGKN